MSYVGPLRASGRFFDGRPSRPRNSIKMENESRNVPHGLDSSRLRVSASRWIPPHATPPHLVVFLSDDHGAIGDAPRSALDMRTSNMTRVAKAGLLFKQAFVNSPACARSRAALLTGQNPSRNGAEANHTKPSAEVRKLPSLLQELGYEVVAFDKVSRYRHTEDYGFEFFPHDGLHNTGHARCWHTRLAKMLALNLT